MPRVFLVQVGESGLELLKHFVIEILEVHEPCLGTSRRSEQFVELQLERLLVPVLRVLNNEDHEERHDRGPGVDDQLPRRRVAGPLLRRKVTTYEASAFASTP